MALSLEDAVRRRQLEEALSYLDTGAVPLDTEKADDGASLDEAPSGRDYPASESSLAPKVSKRIKAEYGDWNEWPTVEPAEVPEGHIDLGPPAPAFTITEDQTGPPVESDILTAPEEQGGGRYVIDKESGRMVPHAELASEADKAEFKPGDVTLPEAVTIGPEVPRAQLVKLPTSFDEPMTPGPSGRQEPVGLKPRPVDILDQIKQQQIAAALPAARAQPVVQPPDIDPGIVRKGDTRGIDPGIVRQGDTRDIDPGIVRQVAPSGLPPTAPNVPGTHTELVPPGQMSLEPDIPAAPTAKAVPAPSAETAQPPKIAVSPELAKGPPGTSPDGTYDEPYWPKKPEQLVQIPPGAYYIDPLDFSEKKMPGTAPAATPAQRPLSPAQPATSAVPGDASTWDNADGTPAPATKAREEMPTVNPDGTPFPERIQAVGGKDPVAIIIHHTGDHHTAAQTAQVLRDRGLGVELTVDREGNVVQIGEAGAANIKTGWGPKGTGLNNSNIIGIEVAANDDKDVLPIQVQAVKNYLAARYPATQVFGHGEVNPGHKEADEGMTIVNAIRGGGAAEGNVGDSFRVLDKLSEAGLNATHFGYQGDPNLDPESAQGHGKYVVDMIPGYDVALNAAAAAIVGNPKPGEEFTFGGRTWRYGDKVPELYKDARFDIFDSGNAIFTGGQLGKTAATTQSKEDWESWDVVSPAEQAAAKTQAKQAVQAAQESDAQKLNEMGQKADNLVGFYKDLTTKPPAGINSAVLKNYQDNLKATIVGEMQKRFPDMTPEVAWAKAQENSSLWDVGSEFWHQGTAAFAQLAPVFAQKSPDKEQVDAFLSQALPGASDADKHAWLSKYYALPQEQKGPYIASHLPGAQAGQRGNDPMAVYTALEHLGDPGYQKAQADNLAAARDFAAKARSSDPRLAGTVGGDIAATGALAEQALAYYGIPIVGAAQASEETRARLKQEHPDWDEQKLDDSAAYSSLASVYGQTIANTLVTRGAGLLFKTLTTPWKRALAQVLAGTVSNIGVNVATQAATNIAEGKPAGVGLPGAVRSGAVQGFIPGLVHGAHELMRPRVEPGAVVRQPTILPPEATTGPKGGEIRGPTERTLEETRPAPPPPIEAHSDQNLEQRSIPLIRTPEEGERGMTEEEAHAYLDTLSNEIEQRHQARASDVGLIPRNENPHATVHDVPPPTPPVPPERFSLGAKVPEQGLSVPEANKVVDAFKEQFPHAPPIEVVGARTELPAHLQDAITQHAGDRAVEALIHDGRVHVVAGENVSPEQLHKALLEESIGHYGVEQVLGPKFNHLADVVSKSMTGHPQYEALKAVYGHDPHTLAAEYIARAARGQIESPSVWAHVKTWFNQFARKLGFKRAFSDSELRVLLSRARGRLEKGGGRSTVVTGTPRFHLRAEDQPSVKGIGIARPTKGELKGPGFMRSAYDALSRNPHTAPLAAALMHHIDRAHELLAKLNKPILEAFRGVKDLPQVLKDVSKIQEARDNKSPIPTGLRPEAYKIVEAMKVSAKMSADLAVKNKVLVFDPRLNGGKGGYRAFHAVGDYVPRSVKRETIDLMRTRHMNAENRKAWTAKVHEYVNKGFIKAGPGAEAEVINLIKGAANLDTRHVDKKLGNIEKARIHRLPSNDYEYSLSGMLDYNRRVSDRMAEIEAYGQRGEMFQKAVDRIEKSSITGSEQADGLIGYVKKIRNQTLGVNERPSLGKAMAIGRSFATGADLSGWTGMLQDLIGSTTQVPMHMGLWNTTKGYLHGLTHLKQMQAHGEDLGVLHDDIASSVRDIDQHYASGTWPDKLARAGQKFAKLGLTISGRAWQENFVRKLTLAAAKYGLRDAVDTIRANPMSRKAGEWAHYLYRRGIDVSRVVAENGQGPESDRFLRRTVGDIQASYDLIQQSPIQRTDGGKFFGQYLGWATNQTRNVAKEVLLPIGRALSGQGQKKIDITVNGKTYKVQDSAFKAVQRGLILAASGAAAVGATDELKEFLLGRINSHRDMKQLAADIASHPDKMETYLHVLSSIYNGVLQSGMLGSVGSLLQYVQDPLDRSRFKDPLHPTVLSKGDALWGFIRRSVQEGQWNSHEADQLMKNWFGAYREGKPIAARIASTLGYSPDVVKEERTRESVAALRNTLKRFNDEQQLGIKPPPGQPLVGGPDASRTTPVVQSITDALYRGDSLAAKKLQEDYLRSIPDAATRKKAAESIRTSIQSSTPLRLGSTSNKDFQAAFWNWAREEGNVTPAQVADFRNLVNMYTKTAYVAGFGKALSIVPEEKGAPKIVSKRAHTAATEILREMIRKENASQALMAH